MQMRDQFPRLLDRKTVLLTGVGGGIGSETALALAAMGARVILAEIDTESGKRTELMAETLRELPLNDLQIEHPFSIVWRKTSIFVGVVRRRFSALLHPQGECSAEASATLPAPASHERRLK